MRESDLFARYPRLWHMAEDESWDSIKAHGLLSTLALLDLYGVCGAARDAILLARRPSSVLLRGAGLPGAVVRDQKPMTDNKLVWCLKDDLQPSDWYALLNAKAFFWLDRKRLLRLLGARAYRTTPHIVIEVDTGSLITSNRDRVMLCPINSGSTLFNPQPRGLSTFLPVSDYAYEPAARGSARGKPPVELVVDYSVPDLISHAVRVDRYFGGETTPVWRPGLRG